MSTQNAPANHPTAIIDSAHPRIVDFARSQTQGVRSSRERAVRLYFAVRDGIRYDPYAIDLSIDGLRASTTLAAGRGWCVAKAVLLTAACRALGIPARVGFADVKNHLSTRRLRALMKTDTFYWHGYSAIALDHRWIKATPTFNIELCHRFHIRPLAFDGTTDAIFHPFDAQGHAHMEYLRYRGEFDDVPLQDIRDSFERHYGRLDVLSKAYFENDTAREVADMPAKT